MDRQINIWRQWRVGEDVNMIQRVCQGQSGDANLSHKQIIKTKNLIMTIMIKLMEMVVTTGVVIMILVALADTAVVMVIVMLVEVMVLIMTDEGVMVSFLTIFNITALYSTLHTERYKDINPI
jgi:hypothetical protein